MCGTKRSDDHHFLSEMGKLLLRLEKKIGKYFVYLREKEKNNTIIVKVVFLVSLADIFLKTIIFFYITLGHLDTTKLLWRCSFRRRSVPL